MEKISVVIPTYNRRRQVLEAIASVRSQTFPPHEIVVVDDGSTDDTAEHLSGTGPPVRYIKTENQGVSAARNRGIREASGDWVAFLDSDDRWAADKLEKQIGCIRKTGAAVCFTGSADDDGQRLDDLGLMDSELKAGESKYYPPGDFRFFLHPRHPFIQSALIRREVLIYSGSFDQSLRVAEDTKMIYSIVLRHGYAALNEPLVTICRKREEKGLSDQDDPKIASERYQCYCRVQSEYFWRLLPVAPAASRVLRMNHGYFASRWAELLSANGEYRAARSVAREALGAAADWKSRIRSLLIVISPGCFGKFVRMKKAREAGR